MKFCENCGIQLEDDAVFCEECGAKQENLADSQSSVSNNNVELVHEQDQINMNVTKNTVNHKVFLSIFLLVVFSPIVLIFIMSLFFMWLPEVLFWIIFIGLQLLALFNMWRNCSWKIWIKFLVVIIYFLMYLI